MSFRHSIGAIRRHGLALSAAFATMMGGAASAQFGEAAGIAESMQPGYFRRDLQIFEQGLNLDETQRVIIGALFQDYETDFQTGLDGMRQKFEDMRPQLQVTDTDKVLKLVFSPFEEWSGEKSQLEDQFLDNVRAVLTEEQIELWPAFEQRLLREKRLTRDARLMGEGLDLFVIIREMQLDEPTMLQIQPVLDAYDVSLDQALRARTFALAGKNNAMLRSLAEQDQTKQLAEYQRQIGMRVAVRNVNDEYIEKIAAALGEEKGKQFRTSALERGYPRVYRGTPVQRLFEQAKALEGLAPDVLAAVTSLETAYLTELDAMNSKLLAALRDFEPIEQRDRAEAFAKRMSGQQVEKAEDPTREMLAQRDDVSRNYAKQLQGLLTQEQFALLPGGFRWVEQPQESKELLEHKARERGGDDPDESTGNAPSKASRARQSPTPTVDDQ